MDDVIFSYTRAEAIADGVLVDISQLAKEAGFRFPVAVTQTVWAEHIAVREDDEFQSEDGRIWDILNLLRFRIHSAADKQLIFFKVLIAKGGRSPRLVELKAHCGPGDDHAPVITIMVPYED